MLKEFKRVRQEGGGQRRRWFEDDGMELVLWHDAVGAVTGFQILYGHGDGEHALTWRSESGFAHNRVDQGDTRAHMKLSPILVPDGVVPWTLLRDEFATRSGGLDDPLRALVLGKLNGRTAHGS